MTNKNYDNQTTGGIVAANFAAASVFQRHGIDFCCHGSTPFTEACRARGLDPEAVAHELDNAADDAPAAVKDFASWPLDLLVDYVLKIHHRNIRTVGPQIEKLLDKVTSVHGAHHPELAEIRHLFRQSLAASRTIWERKSRCCFHTSMSCVRRRRNTVRRSRSTAGQSFTPSG